MIPQENIITVLRAALPNTPDEVLEEWLKPYVELLGWPPCQDIHVVPTGRWRGILSRRSIAFWARVRWQQEDGPIEFADLTSDSQQTVLGLRDAHVYGIPNCYSEIEDGRQRLASIMSHVLKHGSIPSSLIFFEVCSRLAVIDGHHRLLTYFLNRDDAFRANLPSNSAEFSTNLRKWIART